MMAEARSHARFVLGLVLAAFLVHGVLLWIAWHPEQRVLAGDEHRYMAEAERWAAGEIPEPSWLWPPFYGRFLSFVAPLGALRFVAPMVQIALLAGAALLFALIFKRLGGGDRGAWMVASWVLAYPPLAAYAHFFWPEVLHLLLFALALWIVLARSRSVAWMLLLGAVLGLALLTKSLLLPFLPLLLLPLLRTEDRFRVRFGRLGLVALTLFVTVLPTLVQQHRATGFWRLGQSGAFNLWVGLNERSARNRVDPIVYDEYLAFVDSAPTWGERQALLKSKLRTFFAERSLLTILRDQLGRQYFRLFDKDSFLIDMLPGGILGKAGRGYQNLAPGLESAIRWVSYLAYGLLLVLATWGFWLYPPRGRGAWLLLAFVVYNLALFFWLHVKTRYRVPMLPCFFIYAACCLEGWSGDRPPAEGRWRWGLAAVTAGILLFLAF